MLFCDIRSFTSLSESMKPQEILNFLNSYFKHMNQPIANHEGIIDKYVGDAIMAVFNFPENDDKFEAARAVEAAIEMQYMLNEYNGFRKKQGMFPFPTEPGFTAAPPFSVQSVPPTEWNQPCSETRSMLLQGLRG